MTLAAGPVFQDELHARMIAVTEHYLSGTVGRVAFDNQNFEAGAGNLFCQQRIKGFPDGADLVKNRYDD
jgi:hypothetical protein